MMLAAATGPEGLEMKDARAVAADLRRWVPLGARMARCWAEAGRIVGRGTGEGALYPVCQFDAAGLPLPVMQEVIAALRPAKGEAGIMRWLGTPSAALDGARPADLLATRPGWVRGAALAAAGGTGRAA